MLHAIVASAITKPREFAHHPTNVPPLQVNIPQRAITARRVIEQLLHSLRRLGDVLVGVLSPREHCTLGAALLERIAEVINSALDFSRGWDSRTTEATAHGGLTVNYPECFVCRQVICGTMTIPSGSPDT